MTTRHDATDPRNSAVFSLQMANETAGKGEIGWKISKKGGRGGFFSQRGTRFPKITVPRFIRDVLETIYEVTRGLPHPVPDHHPTCDCPACLHALENL